MIDLDRRQTYNNILLEYTQEILERNPQMRFGQLMESIIFPVDSNFDKFNEEPHLTVDRIKVRLEKLKFIEYLELLKDIENKHTQ